MTSEEAIQHLFKHKGRKIIRKHIDELERKSITKKD